MIELNYYTKLKDRKCAVVSDIPYLAKINRLSQFLECEKNLSSEDIERADGKSSSVWLIHSKKTKNIKTYQNNNYSIYLCVFSIMGKDGNVFSAEIEVPSFALSDFQVVDEETQSNMGKLIKVFKQR